MPNEKKLTGWSLIRQQTKDWSRLALLALIKDLHDASAANKDFLRARFQTEDTSGEALEKYRKRIIVQFFPRRGFGQLKLVEARKAINDYKKATGNIIGTIDLMLTYVENGTAFTRQYGDINAAYYSSLESVMNELVGLLQNQEPEQYLRFRERLQSLDFPAPMVSAGDMETISATRFLFWRLNLAPNHDNSETTMCGLALLLSPSLASRDSASTRNSTCARACLA
jgi:hypothetical protein